jgi:choloylglycine hydrolase
MKKMMFMIFIIICMCLVPKTGLPCTAFMLNNNGQPVYGKNSDWLPPIPAFVIVNKRGVAKTSPFLPQEPNAKHISWTSQFGSVTFNMLAREWPQDGINEAGLFITILQGEGLQKDEYPKPDSRTPFGQFPLVQYQLDNFSTVDEVIASFQSIRVARPAENATSQPPAQHWFVGDSQGKCASIEFLDGKLVCHTGWTMPAKVLANSTYDHSIAYFRWYKFLKLFSPIPIPDSARPSLLRFAVASDMARKYHPQSSGPAVDYAFQVLRDVEITPEHHTAIWAVVYDSANKQIRFRSWNSDQVRWFDLSALDFSCTTPVKVLDITTDLSGDVSNSLVDYTKEIDLEMLNSWGFSQELIDGLLSYPDTTVCTE